MTDTTATDRRDPNSDRSRKFLGFPAAAVRRGLWAAYAVVAVTFAATWLLPGAGLAGRVAGQVVWSVVALCGYAASWYVHRLKTGVERRFWGFLSLGGLCIAVGQIYHTYYVATVSIKGPPPASISTALAAAAAISFIALLGTLTRFRHASQVTRVRYLIDVVAATIVAAGVLENWVVGPWLDTFGASELWVRFAFSASPIAGTVMLVGTLLIVLGTRFSRWESWERLIGAAVAVLAVGLIIAPLAYADTVAGFAGGWLSAAQDLILLTGVYLGLAAAIYRLLEIDRVWRLRPLVMLEPSYGWFPSVVLPAIEVLAVPAFGIAAFATDDPSARMLRVALAGTVAVMLAVRTLLTVADTDTLMTGAVTDPLTGLYNHRHFQERLASEIASAVRYGESLSVIALDIDDFRHVNEAGGHGAGDLTFVEVARATERAVRSRDVVCRVGGDEISVIMPGADVAAAFSIASRVLSEVRTVTTPAGRTLSASAGVAAYPQHASNRDDLVRRTEGALYWAKTHGKDRVTVYDPGVVVALDPEGRIRDFRQRADLEAVRALAAAVDARDEATRDHSRNVARHAVTLAQDLGLDERTVLLVEFAGLLHDVGTIGVPDAILKKPGRLTEVERARMQAHAVLGEQILSSTTMRDILPWVRNHHECWDGSGYPDGLAGQDIPLGARILGLANAYDAMRSHRPYRAAMSRSAALQEIDLGLGTAFDPDLGERFIRVVGRRYL